MNDGRTDGPHRGIVVSHTHWDRAWYLPFEVFRHRLVRLVDRLIDLLESDADYRAFTLDGQTVLLHDYLEVRPDREPRLRRLIEDDRLLIGPWYTLPDLFLVSGESVIRNLQKGRADCRAFGGGMDVGYIPDPFGHFAQMPQILSRFGMRTYIFTRGLDRDTKDELGGVFTWRAPDGSSVRAIYQRQGYYPAAALGHPEIFGRFDGHTPDVDLAEERIREAVDLLGAVQDEQTLLLSNGFDHMPEQPDLPALLNAVGQRLDGVDLVHGTLPQFEAELLAEDADPGTYEGELIGNADHPILLSVYSARMYLKRQNHRAQSLLTRWVEPLSAWLEQESLGPDARPFLDRAWSLLLRNHPHDDICGCSVDAVHDDDEVRFRRVDEIGRSLLAEHLETLLHDGGFAAAPEAGLPAGDASGDAPSNGHDAVPPGTSDVFVFNPHPYPVTHDVRVDVFMPEEGEGRADDPRPARSLSAFDASGSALPLVTYATEGDVLRSHYLEATWGRRYTIGLTVDLPPMGYEVVRVVEAGPDAESSPDAESGSEASRRRPGETRIANDTYRISVEDGRLVVEEINTGERFDDALRFQYHLDAGDTYSYGPVPDAGPWWAELRDAAPVAGGLRLTYALTVPARYDRASESPAGETTLTITADVSLTPHHAVAFEVHYENTARDGRLRAVMPTGLRTDQAWADEAFYLQPRTRPEALDPEDHPERYAGYPGELVYTTQHQHDYVLFEGDDRCTWVANRGLPEYEILDGNSLANDAGAVPGTHVAITLHRAVGSLSVEGGRIRRCQAGPTKPTPGAQCLRSMQASFAWGTGAESRNDVLRRARAYAHPAWARELPYLPYLDGNGKHPRRRSLLSVEEPEIDLTAVRPAQGAEEVCALRLCNRSARAQTATVTLGLPAATWCRSDFDETWDATAARPVDGGQITVDLAAHEVATVLLR